MLIMLEKEEEERRYRHARDVVHLTRRNVWGIRMHSPPRPMRIALVV
jgi:hypothetical protein